MGRTACVTSTGITGATARRRDPVMTQRYTSGVQPLGRKRIHNIP